MFKFEYDGCQMYFVGLHKVVLLISTTMAKYL